MHTQLDMKQQTFLFIDMVVCHAHPTGHEATDIFANVVCNIESACLSHENHINKTYMTTFRLLLVCIVSGILQPVVFDG